MRELFCWQGALPGVMGGTLKEMPKVPGNILGNVLVAVLVAVSLAGCGQQRSTEDDIAAIHEVMAQRKQAIEARDLEQFAAVLSPSYQDTGIRRQDVLDYMAALFQQYDEISYSYRKTRPDVKMNTARVIHTVKYSVNGGEKVAQVRETLIFRWQDGRWYIASGIALGVL